MIYKEILEGLDKVSTPNHPGTLIVTDKSEAILTSYTVYSSVYLLFRANIFS